MNSRMHIVSEAMPSRWLAALILGHVLACDNASGPGLRLDVSPDSVQMNRSDTVRLTVNGHLVTGVAVAFESNDTTIATVSNVGLVRGGSAVGRTTIRVSSGGAVTNVPIRVLPVPSGIVMSPGDTVIQISRTVQFRAWVIDEVGDSIPGIILHWRSSDAAIATVTQGGIVTSTDRAGFVFITADFGTLVGGSSIQVAIPGQATEIELAPADTILTVGDSAQLRATARDGFGTALSSSLLIWISDNNAVITVSSTGLVRSMNGLKGRVMIRAVVDTGSGLVEARAFVTAVDSIVAARSPVPNAYGAAISAGNVAYVTNTDGSILRANLPAPTFRQSILVGSNPTGVAFNSPGTRAYVSNYNSSAISVIDVTTNTSVEVIPVGARPFEVIVAPGDSILWVGKEDSVYAVRIATKEIVARFFFGGLATGFAIARDTLLYVSTNSIGTVVEFNLRTRTVARTLTVGGVPQKVTVSPDGSELYIANGSGYVQFWDLGTGLQIGSNLALSTPGYGIARRPSNGLLYVSGGSFESGYLHVIDPATRTVVYTALIGGTPRDVVFDAVGNIGVVANESGWVDFIK
jgi:YVTN family beta-propeller protein